MDNIKATEWFDNLSIEARIEYANNWQKELKQTTVKNAMYKNMTFSMICNSNFAIKAIYNYINGN